MAALSLSGLVRTEKITFLLTVAKLSPSTVAVTVVFRPLELSCANANCALPSASVIPYHFDEPELKLVALPSGVTGVKVM
jgi:hypothetical protein